jgi:3-oxo-5-alpha-steroid 4-dehydrogenase 3 / polyprenol reductase
MLVCAVWAGLLFCALLTKYIPVLNSIAVHGKCSSPLPTESLNGIELLHRCCQIKKSNFRHMYLLGSVLAMTALFQSVLDLNSSTQKILCLFLWLLHNIRRLWETQFMTIFGSSTMHLGGYFAGLVHYTFVPMTIYWANPLIETSSFDFFAIFIFIFASWIQYDSHRVLYQMKQGKIHSKSHSVYEIPTKSCFQYVCCPHYSAEIIIYLSFLVLLHFNASAFLLLVWVATNLSIVANQQYCWYCKHDDARIPRHWCRLIPFVW